MVDKVNAVVLSGGSAFGLDAATGTVRWLEEQNIGWDVRIARVPIVPAAILFDLPRRRQPEDSADGRLRLQGRGRGDQRPGAGRHRSAPAPAPPSARCGGPGRSMKAGLGSYAVVMPNGLVVAAIVAVNAVGDIIDPDTAKVVAGVRTRRGHARRRPARCCAPARRRSRRAPGENTTIGLVATNARLTKADAHRMALMADDGFARAIFPSHTMGDGDTVFSLATGRWTGEATSRRLARSPPT